MNNEIAYELKSDKSFDEVVANIERLAPENNFRVLAVHDVQGTLAEKGFERGPLKIIEICNAGFADKALKADINVSLFMPCRFSVTVVDGQTIAKLSPPTLIASFLPDSGLEELAQEVEDTLKKVMQEAV